MLTVLFRSTTSIWLTIIVAISSVIVYHHHYNNTKLPLQHLFISTTTTTTPSSTNTLSTTENRNTMSEETKMKQLRIYAYIYSSHYTLLKKDWGQTFFSFSFLYCSFRFLSFLCAHHPIKQKKVY